MKWACQVEGDCIVQCTGVRAPVQLGLTPTAAIRPLDGPLAALAQTHAVVRAGSEAQAGRVSLRDGGRLPAGGQPDRKRTFSAQKASKVPTRKVIFILYEKWWHGPARIESHLDV